MSKELKKVVSLKEFKSLDDIKYKEGCRGLGDLYNNSPTLKVTKTFKVANYNKGIKNGILKNLEIEIEGIAIKDDKDFGKELNHFFNRASQK